MDIQSLKIELVKRILNTDSTDLIRKLYGVLGKEDKDFWLELSADQKAEIELGIKQLNNDETEDWDSFLKRVS